VNLHGGVGREKTMLIDSFFATLPPSVAASARRVHFHEFMAETHGAMHALAQRHRRGGGGIVSAADPLASVAASLVARSPLVCFDEVELSDVADALVFKRLFEKAFDYGGVLVATSNCAPDQLYAGGINRDRFAPFADALRERCEIVSLDEEGAGVSETAGRVRAATHPKASTGIRTDPEPPERDASASAAAGVDYRAARYEKSIASSRGEGGAARLPASRAKEGPAGGETGSSHPRRRVWFDDDGSR
jgi:Predicted ATPase